MFRIKMANQMHHRGEFCVLKEWRINSSKTPKLFRGLVGIKVSFTQFKIAKLTLVSKYTQTKQLKDIKILLTLLRLRK